MLYGMVQNEQDAWDLAQEGFLKAWKSIHRFKSLSSFYTWLYRIMTNVTIDSLRRKGIHGETEFDDRIAPANVEPGSRTTLRPSRSRTINLSNAKFGKGSMRPSVSFLLNIARS
jgi:RNA polymerase sigma-70 factor (ECF subfamily)